IRPQVARSGGRWPTSSPPSIVFDVAEKSAPKSRASVVRDLYEPLSYLVPWVIQRCRQQRRPKYRGLRRRESHTAADSDLESIGRAANSQNYRDGRTIRSEVYGLSRRECGCIRPTSSRRDCPFLSWLRTGNGATLLRPLA